MNIYAMQGRFRTFWRAIILLRGHGPAVYWVILSLCGMALPASALVGPAREAPQYAPYVVVVLDQTGSKTNVCSASVVARNVVLTAAHCVNGLAGAHVFYRESTGDGVLLGVQKIAINPDYAPDSSRQSAFSIDLALLLLSEPLPSKFRPVELDRTGPVAVGQRVRIAGFGLSDEDKVRIASFGPSNEDISGTSGVLRAGVLISSGPKSKFAVLVDPAGTGLGGCTGDSGAPIFAGNGSQQVAVAIKARGEGGYQCGDSTLAVQLAPQMSWIRETLHDWGAVQGQAQ
ncbi:MAG TPA: trypsin-like serine protease [Methylocella sp.]|nr:trypsin-like serine protease [Methylocella sp.]